MENKEKSLVVALSGSTGLVGQAVQRELKAQGHRVVPIVRNRARAADTAIVWDPKNGLENPQEAFAEVDAVIHLAGRNIADGRWNDAVKADVLASRVDGTKGIVHGLEASASKVTVFLCASGSGWYGSRGDEELTESSTRGTGFLSEVCRQWEEAAMSPSLSSCRVHCMRTGVVLSPEGGALKKMLPPAKLGLGGPLGSGMQWFPWVSLRDTARAYVHLLTHDRLASGPVNVCAPSPVRQKDFASELGRTLKRPAFLPAPPFALKLLLGSEMAEELLLASTRCIPQALQESGFEFLDGELASAFPSILRD